MNDASAQPLLVHLEPLAVISITHLRPATRQRLADGGLSVTADPNNYGGFIYVGFAGKKVPDEPELVPTCAAAQAAGIVWIKFDADAESVEGFDTFGDQEQPS